MHFGPAALAFGFTEMRTSPFGLFASGNPNGTIRTESVLSVRLRTRRSSLPAPRLPPAVPNRAVRRPVFFWLYPIHTRDYVGTSRAPGAHGALLHVPAHRTSPFRRLAVVSSWQRSRYAAKDR